MDENSESDVVPNTLFEFAPDAILIVGPDGCILKANPQAVQMFGYHNSELTGQPVELLIPHRFVEHADKREQYAMAPHARRMGAGNELFACRRDGSEFPVEVALGPAPDQSKQQVLCIIRDITDRKKSEQTLRRAHDNLELRVQERTAELSRANRMLKAKAAQLERSNRELQDFAFVASHDLQEPLRKIMAFGDRIKRSDGFDAQSVDYLERMQSAALRMHTLINDLLDYSRVTTQAQPFQMVYLEQIAREVLSDLEVQIEQAEAKIEIGRLPCIEADATQMRQLFQNLIGNAIKFRHPERKPNISILARQLSVDSEAQIRWEISVRDNGIGFEPKYGEKIFGLFQRLHGRGAYAGSGVGLAICRKIAERHGGRIFAIGIPGQGATFSVTLLRTQPDSESTL